LRGVKFRIDKVGDKSLDPFNNITATVVQTPDPLMLNTEIRITLWSDDKRDDKTLRKKLENCYKDSFQEARRKTWFKTLEGRIL